MGNLADKVMRQTLELIGSAKAGPHLQSPRAVSRNPLHSLHPQVHPAQRARKCVGLMHRRWHDYIRNFMRALLSVYVTAKARTVCPYRVSIASVSGPGEGGRKRGE